MSAPAAALAELARAFPAERLARDPERLEAYGRDESDLGAYPPDVAVLVESAEEIREVEEAVQPEHVAEELGDLFFALVNLARWKKVDAESALRATNLKFKTRFAHIEAGARGQSRNLSDLSLDEMESLWQEAKKK